MLQNKVKELPIVIVESSQPLNFINSDSLSGVEKINITISHSSEGFGNLIYVCEQKLIDDLLLTQKNGDLEGEELCRNSLVGFQALKQKIQKSHDRARKRDF